MNEIMSEVALFLLLATVSLLAFAMLCLTAYLTSLIGSAFVRSFHRNFRRAMRKYGAE